jgi:hypothetical protein
MKKARAPMTTPDRTPFCGQPWSTLYVQWDGKVTRPCIRGPQNMGDLSTLPSVEDVWNGVHFQAVRRSLLEEAGMNAACSGCFKSRSRTIDHLTPFANELGGYSYDQIDNYYLATDAAATGDLNPVSKPVVIVMDMSSKCHIRCPKCFVYNSDMQYQLGHMPMTVFEKITPYFKTALEVIGHENGECMLHKQFFEMVGTIKAHGCRFMFNTTGQLIDETKARRLVDLKVDTIMFSIDGTEPETYARLHKGGTLERVMGAIDHINHAKQAGGHTEPRLGWYFVASKSNIGQLQTAVQRAIDLGFRMMYVGHLNRPTAQQWKSYFDFYRAESLFRNPDDQKLYDEALSHAKETALRNGLEFFTGSADA